MVCPPATSASFDVPGILPGLIKSENRSCHFRLPAIHNFIKDTLIAMIIAESQVNDSNTYPHE